MSKATRLTAGARPTAGAAVEHGPGAVQGEQFPVKGRQDQRARLADQGPQGSHQHPVEGFGGLALLGHLLGGLGHGQPLGQATQVFAQLSPRFDRLRLANYVELAPFVQQQLHMAQGLETAPDAALGTPDTLGHRPHLAVTGRQQDHYPVCLAQLVRPQHDPTVAI